MSTPGRLLVILVAATVAVTAFLLLRDSNDDHAEPPITTPAKGGKQAQPAPPTIVIENGEPVGGPADLDFDKGSRIRFTVKSDVDEEVHLHGYDVSKDVRAGGEVSFNVPATIDGVFEAELEHSGVEITQITVNP